MPIPHWPQNERPREKLLSQGPHTLSDAELLAIFIRTGVRGKSAVDLGRDLLQEFGSLRSIVNAERERFCKCHGLGITKYVQLQAALEIALRFLHENLQRNDVMTNPKDTYRYLTACLRKHEHEVFACLFLDNANRVIRFEELFHGSISSATIHPREVVKRSLSCNAAAVILAHNHPSGIAEPSEADKHITLQLKKALALVDIRILDHIIVGDGQVVSFAECGLL
jgi:DNA repair protein RadC